MIEPREFLIDMSLPAQERWQDAVAACKRAAARMARTVLSDIDRMPLGHVARGAITAGHRRVGSPYDDDVSAWAAALGLPHRDMIVANAAFELPQLADKVASATSVVLRSGDVGLVHGRNLDWELDELGTSSVVYHFVGCPLEYMAVSVPGVVGVHSGMGPGRFSVTVNPAPHQGGPTLDWAPAMLARHVLATVRTYREAMTVLSETPLRSPAIFTVVGVGAADACVIERTRKDGALREYSDAPLAATGHYQTETLKGHNLAGPALGRSTTVARAVIRACESAKVRDLGDLFSVLDAEGVHDGATRQQSAFAPEHGLYCAVGCDRTGA